MSNSYENFKKYQVTDVETVEEFQNKYHKPARYTERGEEYVKCVINSSYEELRKYGFTIITHHDSITGKCVSFYK